MSTIAAPETRRRGLIMVELYSRAYWRAYLFAGMWVTGVTGLGLAFNR